MYIYIYIYTYIHTYTHGDIHTYIHTLFCIFLDRQTSPPPCDECALSGTVRRLPSRGQHPCCRASAITPFCCFCGCFLPGPGHCRLTRPAGPYWTASSVSSAATARPCRSSCTPAGSTGLGCGRRPGPSCIAGSCLGVRQCAESASEPCFSGP